MVPANAYLAQPLHHNTRSSHTSLCSGRFISDVNEDNEDLIIQNLKWAVLQSALPRIITLDTGKRSYAVEYNYFFFQPNCISSNSIWSQREHLYVQYTPNNVTQ